jgi:OOP family OmpA-OmpF porin
MRNKKCKVIYPLTLGVALATGTTVVTAADQGIYLAPSVGYYFFDGDEDSNTDDAMYYGLGLGVQFSKYFALEAGYFELDNPETLYSGYDVDKQLHLQGVETDGKLYRIEGIFNLDLSLPVPVVPYLSIGYAKLEQDPKFNLGNSRRDTPIVVSTDDDKNQMMSLGLGVKYKITDAFAVHADVRGFHSFDNEDTDYGANLGVSYLFGTKAVEKKVETPVTKEGPSDQDGDGVTDDIDQCPDTPVGATVDSVGCPLDSDGDGIPDYRDKCPGTPEGAKVDQDGCALKLKEAVSITLDVKFDTGRSVVKPDYYAKIQEIAQFMREYPDTNTVIEGHTDDVGKDSSNQRLSEQRANAVREILVSRFAVNPARLRAIGYGESRPIGSNKTPAGRAQNRRVVAVVEAIAESTVPK